MELIIRILAWTAIVFVGLAMLLSPKSDKRFRTGNKGNASSDGLGCFVGFALIVGILAGLLNLIWGTGSFFDLDVLGK